MSRKTTQKAEVLKPTEEDVQAVRLFVRTREDLQSIRKKMDNRIGRKANGEAQNIQKRVMRLEDVKRFAEHSKQYHAFEEQSEKELKKILKRFPIYNKWMESVKGLGAISAGWIIAEFDIHEATTVSKMWQFAGLNPGMVEGKKRVKNEDDTFSHVPTGKMVRGDRLTPDFVAPFNKRLRTALLGVLATSFLQNQACYRWEICTEEQFEQLPEEYRSRREKIIDGIKNKNIPCQLLLLSPYAKLYFDYKQRLKHSEKQTVTIIKKGENPSPIKWKDCSDGHINSAAKRYMIKMFLKDLYVEWRKIEGLPVREPYQEEYLKHKHKGK